MKNSVIRVTAGTLLVLLVPLVMTLLRPNEWDWNLADFIIIGSLLFVAGLIYELIANKIKDRHYRIIIGLVIAIFVLLIWADLAVGIFGLPWSGS